jgi:hypothetical protein
MPLSHHYRTIFIHIPKTAGTSVEAALGMHGGNTDVGVVPYLNQQIDREHLYGRDLQHLTAAQMSQVLSNSELFSAYFKFTIVRNPWERLVSTLAWTGQKWARGIELDRAGFDAQLHGLDPLLQGLRAKVAPATLPPHLKPQVSYIAGADGQPLVDFVARYETLEEDWRRICARLGVQLALPRRMRSHHGQYREYYSDATRALVAETYAADIASFGYEF